MTENELSTMTSRPVSHAAGRPSLPPTTPFFETPAGELFFRNLLFATPAMVIMVPIAMKALLTAVGLLSGPSRIFDTLPIVASYALPYVGWLFALAIRPVLRNLTMPVSPRVRGVLFGFLLIHIGVLAATVLAWVR